MVLTTEKLDVVIFLIEVEVEVAPALGAFQPPGEHARLLCNGGFLSPSAFLQRLHLFPSSPVNSIKYIESDQGMSFLITGNR